MKDRKTNNDLQNTTEKTKIEQHKLHKKNRCLGILTSSCSTSGTDVLLFCDQIWFLEVDWQKLYMKDRKTNNDLQNTTEKTKIEQHKLHKKTGA
jgi:hypothetical protein